ncbi:unnamed protein product [Amoebophrya sp. A25]|nr:unnamed protein product [Amoebophrya sp. A25]|eukprot:GSA25T00013500001.1
MRGAVPLSNSKMVDRGRFPNLKYDPYASQRYVREESLPRSVHKGVTLWHGRAAADPNLRVTVKVRDFVKGFSDHDTHERWIRNMNAFLMRKYYSPHVALVYEIIYDDENYYMVMERVDGMDLWEYISMERKRPGVSKNHLQAVLKRYIMQAACGLRDLHAGGIYHKDVKAENMVVGLRDQTHGGFPRLKLIDFDTCECISNCFKPHWILGTDHYIAPEVYHGEYAPQSEVLALGATLYRILTMKLPFPKEIFTQEQPGNNYVGSEKTQRLSMRMSSFLAEKKFDHREQIIHEYGPVVHDFLRQALAVYKWDSVDAEMRAYNRFTRANVLQLIEHSWFDEVRHTVGVEGYARWREWDRTSHQYYWSCTHCQRDHAVDPFAFESEASIPVPAINSIFSGAKEFVGEETTTPNRFAATAGGPILQTGGIKGSSTMLGRRSSTRSGQQMPGAAPGAAPAVLGNQNLKAVAMQLGGCGPSASINNAAAVGTGGASWGAPPSSATGVLGGATVNYNHMNNRIGLAGSVAHPPAIGTTALYQQHPPPACRAAATTNTNVAANFNYILAQSINGTPSAAFITGAAQQDVSSSTQLQQLNALRQQATHINNNSNKQSTQPQIGGTPGCEDSQKAVISVPPHLLLQLLTEIERQQKSSVMNNPTSLSDDQNVFARGASTSSSSLGMIPLLAASVNNVGGVGVVEQQGASAKNYNNFNQSCGAAPGGSVPSSLSLSVAPWSPQCEQIAHQQVLPPGVGTPTAGHLNEQWKHAPGAETPVGQHQTATPATSSQFHNYNNFDSAAPTTAAPAPPAMVNVATTTSFSGGPPGVLSDFHGGQRQNISSGNPTTAQNHLIPLTRVPPPASDPAGTFFLAHPTPRQQVVNMGCRETQHHQEGRQHPFFSPSRARSRASCDSLAVMKDDDAAETMVDADQHLIPRRIPTPTTAVGNYAYTTAAPPSSRVVNDGPAAPPQGDRGQIPQYEQQAYQAGQNNDYWSAQFGAKTANNEGHCSGRTRSKTDSTSSDLQRGTSGKGSRHQASTSSSKSSRHCAEAFWPQEDHRSSGSGSLAEPAEASALQPKRGRNKQKKARQQQHRQPGKGGGTRGGQTGVGMFLPNEIATQTGAVAPKPSQHLQKVVGHQGSNAKHATGGYYSNNNARSAWREGNEKGRHLTFESYSQLYVGIQHSKKKTRKSPNESDGYANWHQMSSGECDKDQEQHHASPAGPGNHDSSTGKNRGAKNFNPKIRQG